MKHLPTIKQLRYLSTLAETRHFGQAAKACFVSQSTLSAGIHELEQTLGITLVERDNRNVLLTPLGEQALNSSRRILNELDDLVGVCEASKEPFTQHMRLGVIPTIAPYILPALLNRLRQQYPQFRLFIREQLSETLVNALHRGELDVLLLALPYAADRVETRHLFYDSFYLAFLKNSKLASKTKLFTADLVGQEVLLLEDGHCLRDHVLEACRLKDTQLNMPYQATSLNTIVQMVANGIGVTLLPQMALKAKILAGTRLQIRQFDEPNVWRSIGLMWRQKSPRAAEFQLLGQFINNWYSTTGQ